MPTAAQRTASDSPTIAIRARVRGVERAKRRVVGLRTVETETAHRKTAPTAVMTAAVSQMSPAVATGIGTVSNVSFVRTGLS
jgi:hypothetical protein